MTLHLTSITVTKPERLVGLEEYEALVRASNAPAVLIIDRTHMLWLLDYVRRLEAEVKNEGGFW